MPEFRIGQRSYPSKKAAGDAVREVLYGYSVGSTVDREEDHLLLLDLLGLHEEAEAKIGSGVEAFVIAPPQRGPYPGFAVVRTDGTRIDFSYLACLNPPSYRQQVTSAMRVEVQQDVNAYFTSRVAAGTLVSDQSGVQLDYGDTHVSYVRGPSFAEIAAEFAEAVGGWEAIELTASTDQGLGTFTDRVLAERWRTHHAERAVLGLLSSQENLRRPYGPPSWEMKPKPFSVLNHLTVPLAMLSLPVDIGPTPREPGKQCLVRRCAAKRPRRSAGGHCEPRHLKATLHGETGRHQRATAMIHQTACGGYLPQAT